MCGIVGAYGAAPDLKASLERITHRGPDGHDIVSRINSSLGHTRLAIIDIEGGDQPLKSADGRQWLICNGEIYNHMELRQSKHDYNFRTLSDSEVILALYEQHGTDAVQKLDGMFAFALVDEDRILLARDPLGIKPLYYGWKAETLYFASEIKALYNIVEEIKEFPPGHWYDSKTGFVRYYDVQKVAEQSSQTPQRPTIKDIHHSLKKAVQKRLMSDVPVGVFLSGGLDSSIIAGLVSQSLPNVHSFSVGFHNSQDLAYARQVATYLGTHHHEYIYTIEDMLEALPSVIYHLESFDPSLVRSAIPNFFLARLARKYVTVVLSGEGADELYAGYSYLKQIGSDELTDELIAITDTLHSCNLLRCDRMAMAHGLEARVPFLDTEFIHLSFAVPNKEKIYGTQNIEKWALRKAFEGIIPDDVIWRVKEQFSKGAGSAYVFEELAETEITDSELKQATQEIYHKTGHMIYTKEELYYYRIFTQFFPVPITSLVKRWRGHKQNERL